MKLKEIVEKLDLKVYCGEELLEREVVGGYSSDLLSDVMGHADEGYAWITLQTHKNIIGVASLKDLAVIILEKGLEPDEESVELAKQEEIPIVGSDKGAFELAGILYNLLNG